MTEQKNQLASLFAACWKDEALKARFMSENENWGHPPIETS